MKRLSLLPLLCTTLFAGCSPAAETANTANATTEVTAAPAPVDAPTEAPAPAKTYAIKDPD
ncbi:hypothetical protein EON80_26750, partial [bacterium]